MFFNRYSDSPFRGFAHFAEHEGFQVRGVPALRDREYVTFVADGPGCNSCGDTYSTGEHTFDGATPKSSIRGGGGNLTAGAWVATRPGWDGVFEPE